jgi:anion-transporting  ArsA/GET3 family ATPase
VSRQTPAFPYEASATAKHPFRDVRLHVVTGKGGTGKTTVAAALAIALAAGGRRVLLAEVEGRQGIAQLFDCPPLPYEERKVASAPGAGEVFALAVDPEEALLEYLEMFYNMRLAGRTLKKMGAIDFATTIAPGMRDVLLTGKVKEAVTREDRKRRTGQAYDAVVMDAPPTGRITRFLNVTTEVAGLARVGPIRTQADSVMAVLRSKKSAVHLVTLLEEMPVQETVDGVSELRSAELPVGAVLVNRTRDPLLSEADLAAAEAGGLDRAELAAGLKAAGIEADEPMLDTLTAEAADHARRVALEQEERGALEQLQRPTYELPQLPDSVDLGGLYRLAELLTEQGMAG